MAGSHNGNTPTSPSGGGKDFIADMDNKRHEEEWSWSIVGAMAKIQMQYAVEQGLDRNLPKDYFTDSDKLKFFWSGFSNSTATKHIIDIIFRSIINWEIIFILLASIFVQVFIFSTLEEAKAIELFSFTISYFSIICYSIYITTHFRYFVFGDLSARMMLYLMIGRLIFLALSALILSSFLFWMVAYFENTPKELYGWTSGIYWIFGLFGKAETLFQGKEELFWITYKSILPKIKEAANEMLIIFLCFGFIPFFILIMGKTYRKTRIKNENEKFNKGEL